MGSFVSLAVAAIPAISFAAQSPNETFSGVTHYAPDLYEFYNGTYDDHIHITTYQAADLNSQTADAVYVFYQNPVPNVEKIGNGEFGIDYYSDPVGTYELSVYNKTYLETGNSGDSFSGNLYVTY